MIFEAHIILPSSEASRVASWAKEEAAAWSLEIDGDPLLGVKPHCHLNRHYERYEWLLSSMLDTRNRLRAQGIEVLRMKIELIMYDTKTGVGL